MVTVDLQLELPDWEAVTSLMESIDAREDCKIVSFEFNRPRPCPECGKPMHYSEELQTHVCGHDE